mgnify:FL=1
MTITRLPKRIHALSLAAALGASTFVLPGASATEAEAINVNDCLASLISSEFASNCPYENLELEVDTVEVLVQSIENGKATVRLAPLYEGAYVGDASRVYLVMQYYTPAGSMTASDTFEPTDIKTERAADGSMLLTFTMPQMPAEGYYSISAMDLETSDMGYGEFKISEGFLIPHFIPVENDPDEAYAEQDGGNHQLTADELKALAKIREEEKKSEQKLNQQNGNQEVSSEVAPVPAETSDEAPHVQKVQEVPGSTTASRDSQTPPKLSVEYAEVRSDSETKPVTISAKYLPAYKGGYDLMVVESDANGNVKGEAISYTHINPDSIVNGEFSVAIGMPGSLLKSGSVYTAFLVRSDDIDTPYDVASVRFIVTGVPAPSAEASKKAEQPRQDVSATVTPSTKTEAATSPAQSNAQSSVSTSDSKEPASSAPQSTLAAVSAMSQQQEAKAERQRQALQTLAQARTMTPRSAVEPTRTDVVSAYRSGSDPASIAAAANSGTVAQGPTSDATSGNGNKGFTPVIHSETNTRSAAVNSTTTQVQSNTNADRQDGVKAAASVAAPTSEEVAQHGTAFWAIGGVGLTLVVGAAWMAHRRGFLSS